MTIYAERRQYETTFGKEIPAMGPFKNFNPKLQGPGGSKIKAGLYGAYQLGKFVSRRPWARGTLTGTLIGTGTGLIGKRKNARTNQFNKALRTNIKHRYRKRRSFERGACQCCNCTCH